VDALRKGLNLAYDVKESRPLWKTSLLAFGMAVGGGLLVLAGIALLVAGGSVGGGRPAISTSPTNNVIVIRWIRWPIIAINDHVRRRAQLLRAARCRPEDQVTIHHAGRGLLVRWFGSW